MKINIIVAGVGGQGNVTAAYLLGVAALEAGFNVRVADVYGLAQRGGAVVSHVRIGRVYSPLIGKGEADVIVSLEPMEALRNAAKFVKREGVVLTNTYPIYPIEASVGEFQYPETGKLLKAMKKLAKTVVAINAQRLANEAGLPIAANIAMLGALAALEVLPFTAQHMRSVVEKYIPRFKEENLKAFNLGFRACGEVLSHRDR